MDIARHFGLRADPFGSVADPAEAVDTDIFRAALQRILGLVEARQPLVALVGDPGVGKTLLLRAVQRKLETRERTVQRLSPADIGQDMFPDAEVLLIDEVERGDMGALPSLLRKSTDGAGPSIVMALLPQSIDRARELKASIVPLDRLSGAEARSFVLDRIARVGGSRGLIVPGALSSIVYAADGLPSNLRRIAGTALLEAALDGSKVVEMKHAKQAVATHRGAAEPAGMPPPPERQEPADSAPLADAPAERPAAVSPALGSQVPVGAATLIVSPRTAAAAEPAPELQLGPDDETTGRPRRRIWPFALAAMALLAAVVAAALLWRLPQTDASISRSPPADAPPAADAAIEPETAPPVAPAPQAEKTVEPPSAPETSPASEIEQAPAAPPPAAPPLEPAPVPESRIIVEYSRDLPGAAAAADRIVAALQARGYDRVDVRSVEGPIRAAETRYPAASRNVAKRVEEVASATLRVYQPDVASRLVEDRSGDPAAIRLRVPDSAADAVRPLRMDRQPF